MSDEHPPDEIVDETAEHSVAESPAEPDTPTTPAAPEETHPPAAPGRRRRRMDGSAGRDARPASDGDVSGEEPVATDDVADAGVDAGGADANAEGQADAAAARAEDSHADAVADAAREPERESGDIADPDDGRAVSGDAAERADLRGDGVGEGVRDDAELFDPQEVADAPRAPHPLKPVVEALIFASPEPLTLKAMSRLLEEHAREEIEAALAEVRDAYGRSDGLQLVEVAGGYQIVTRPELYEWVRRLFKERSTSKLSVQALETLAVIAYKQPVTSGEIAEIRGVSATTGVLNTLLDRKLVKIVGRKQVVGRPFMYGTTREFLDKFGLRDLSDLPKVEDMSDALGFDLPTPVDEGDGVSLPFDGPADDVAPDAEPIDSDDGSGPAGNAVADDVPAGEPEDPATPDASADADPSDDER